MITIEDFKTIAEGYNVSNEEAGVLNYVQFYKSNKSVCGTMLDINETIVDAEHIYQPIAVYQPKSIEYKTRADIAQKMNWHSKTADLIDMPSVY